MKKIYLIFIALTFLSLNTYPAFSDTIKYQENEKNFSREATHLGFYTKQITEGIHYLEQREYDKAKYHFQKAKKLLPDKPDAYINLATVYMHEDNFPQAIKLLNKAAKIVPDDYPQKEIIFYNLGVCFYREENYAKSKEYYLKALQINPGFNAASYGLGKSYQGLLQEKAAKKEPRAEKDKTKYITKTDRAKRIKKSPKARPESKKRALATGRKARPSTPEGKAEPIKEEGLQTGPEITSKVLAEEKTEAAETQKELALLELRGEKDPYSLSDVLMNAGSSSFESGNLTEAITFMEKSTALNPKNAEAYYRLGVIYAKQEKFEAAGEAFKKAINNNPKFAKAYTNLGSVYGELKQYRKALRILRKALKIDKTNPKIHYNIGMAYLALGNKSTAGKYFQKARQLSLEKNDKEFLEKIDKIYKPR